MHRAQRRAPVGVRLHVQQRAEGDDDERNRPSTGGSRRSPRRRSTSTPAVLGVRRATSSMPCDESTPITSMPLRAIGTAIRPVPTAELDDRAARAPRLLDVERDVLDDAAPPRVVELGDRVVEGHAAMLPAPDGARPNEPVYAAPARAGGRGARLVLRVTSRGFDRSARDHWR